MVSHFLRPLQLRNSCVDLLTTPIRERMFFLPSYYKEGFAMDALQELGLKEPRQKETLIGKVQGMQALHNRNGLKGHSHCLMNPPKCTASRLDSLLKSKTTHSC